MEFLRLQMSVRKLLSGSIRSIRNIGLPNSQLYFLLRVISLVTVISRDLIAAVDWVTVGYYVG
jgi:hypothetical protein